MRNTPDEYVTRIPIGVVLPKFFLAAGAADTGDVRDAQFFRQQLLLRVASVPLVVVPGGGHQARVWRAALAPLLEWMTPQLTATARQYERQQARRAAMSKELLGTVPPITVHPPKATATR
jgi:hypothetical protein